MINLDFRTNNRAHGYKGVYFNDLFAYIKSIGFLSNIKHYKNCKIFKQTSFEKTISIHTELNDTDGAWGKECRIHYYGDAIPFKSELFDLYNCKSAGRGNITFRINSNDFIKMLIIKYNFGIVGDGYIKDIYPPENAYDVVLNIIIDELRNENISIDNIKSTFDEGWYL